MKRHGSLLAAGMVAAAIVAVGWALVRLGAKKRETERRAAAVQAAATTASVMQIQLEELLVAVYSSAMKVSRKGVANGSQAASSIRFTRGRTSLFIVSVGSEHKIIPIEGRALRFEDLPSGDWATSTIDSGGADPPAIAAKPEFLSPFEASSGEWLVMARMFVPFSAKSSSKQPGGWVVCTLPLEKLVASSGLQSLARKGYEYNLAEKDGASGSLRVFLRSTEAELSDPIQQKVPGTGDRWILSIAPNDGWSPRSPILIQSGLLLMFALIAGLYTHDRTEKQQNLDHEIEAGRERLKKASHLLTNEIKLREALERQFSDASVHDALTGLPNRRYFLGRLERALQRARHRAPEFVVGVLVLNLERFDAVNESLGHEAGNKLLVLASQRLEGCLRSSDLATVRLGADQFAVLLVDVGNPMVAGGVARRFQEALALPFDLGGQTVFTTASMGVALSSSGIYNADELVRGAHIALSRSKLEGPGHYAIFDPSATDQIVARQQLETNLHQAIEKRQLRLNLQPIVDLETGYISGMETLVRWYHPLEGVVSPDRFIHLAEETGLIVSVTRWVMREACALARAWRERFPADLPFYLSVNLSAEDLREADLCDFVAGVVSDNSLPPGVLRLEVTEGIMIGNVKAASDLVSRLRGMGIPLLLDDFGTGYSSLSYLQRFKFDYVKIDRAFVSRITPAGENIAFVRAIVDLTSDLSMRTIAEGVETADQMRHLRSLGCNYGQGYLFSKPVDPTSAERLLLSRPKWSAVPARAS